MRGCALARGPGDELEPVEGRGDAIWWAGDEDRVEAFGSSLMRGGGILAVCGAAVAGDTEMR